MTEQLGLYYIRYIKFQAQIIVVDRINNEFQHNVQTNF